MIELINQIGGIAGLLAFIALGAGVMVQRYFAGFDFGNKTAKKIKKNDLKHIEKQLGNIAKTQKEHSTKIAKVETQVKNNTEDIKDLKGD